MNKIKAVKTHSPKALAEEERATKRVIFLLTPAELGAIDSMLDGRQRAPWIRKVLGEALEHETLKRNGARPANG